MGFVAADTDIRAIYFELREKVPLIREILGELKAVSSYDIEFNTDVARALRAAKVER